MENRVYRNRLDILKAFRVNIGYEDAKIYLPMCQKEWITASPVEVAIRGLHTQAYRISGAIRLVVAYICVIGLDCQIMQKKTNHANEVKSLAATTEYYAIMSHV